jgi:NADH-quinone oxidoreductase subunit A
MLAQAVSPAGESVSLLTAVLLFLLAGVAMALGALLIGALVRTRLHHPVKDAIYECGEPTIGKSCVQFDLRFYVVALVFVIFDVEIALFWPWAVIFGGGGLGGEAGAVDTAALAQVRGVALWDMLFFFGVIVIGFLFLWRYGYLDWVRASDAQRRREPKSAAPGAQPAAGGVG